MDVATLNFFDVWKYYVRARAESSADYKMYSDELNKRIADARATLKCDVRGAIEHLMKR